MRLSLWSARMAPRSRSAPAASSPSCPLSLCRARYQFLPCRWDGLRKGTHKPGRGSWTRWHCQTHGPRGHLHGLDDGDHISLVEGQLAGLGLGVVVLGDALRPRRPVLLQEEGSVTGMLSPEVSPRWKDCVVTWDGDNILMGWDALLSQPCAGAVQERTVSPAHPGHDWPSAHQELLSAPDVTCREETKWGHKEMRLSQSSGLVPPPPRSTAVPQCHMRPSQRRVVLAGTRFLICLQLTAVGAMRREAGRSTG